jgi:uncharacterized protein (DUF736 family)
MSAIGYVTRTPDGFKGQIRTLSIRTDIEIVPNRAKTAANQPDYRVLSGPVELGAGWIKTGEQSGNTYVSLGIAAPEFGPRRIYVNLGRAAGQDDDDVFALIWNPAD